MDIPEMRCDACDSVLVVKGLFEDEKGYYAYVVPCETCAAQPARSEAGDAGEPDLSDATCYNGNHPAKDGICLVDGGYKPSSR